MKFFSLFTSVVSVFFFLAMPFAASADLVPAGQHAVNSCYRISNTKEFPNYTFLLLGRDAIDSTAVLQSGVCAPIYKFSNPFFAAVKNDDFKRVLGDKYTVHPSGTVVNSDDVGVGDILADMDVVIALSQQLLKPSEATLPDANPLDERRYVYHASKINGTTLEIVPDAVTYMYLDKTSETLSATNGIFPEASKSFSWKRFVNTGTGMAIGGIVVVAACALLGMRLMMKKKKRAQ